ncbi:MAG: polysaccharide deacetylase family protein [Ktedonobacteraceae bacterium]
MFKQFEILVAACLYYSGLVKLARWWTQRSGPRLIVLCYHRAAGKYLRQQLLYLSRSYRVLHLETALEELYKPREDELQRKDRRTLLVLTFDDGYHDNYTDGLALARETQTPLTVFLLPGYIESGSRFWWQEPKHLLLHTNVREATIDGRMYHVDKSGERKALTRAIEARLRLATSIAEREEFLVAVRKVLADTLPTNAQEKGALPLTWAEINEMEESGWISFGGHTMHHPILGYLADPAEAQYEVSECRAVLERQLGHPVRTFAYPYGGPEHIGENGLRAAREAKYDWAVTTIYGFNTPQTERHLLHRIVVDVDQHWLVVAAKASGVWEFFMRPCRMPIDFIMNIFRRKLVICAYAEEGERTLATSVESS